MKESCTSSKRKPPAGAARPSAADNIGFPDIEIEYWSPNKVTVHVNEMIDDLIILNRNFDDSWYVEIDKKILKANNFNGLLSFNFRGKSKRVSFIYKYSLL